MEETRRGVVIDVVDKAAIKKIEKDLTVAPIVDTSFGGFPKKHKYFVYNAKKTRIAVPRFYEGVVATERAYGRADPAPDLVFRGALNPSLRQPEAVAATLDAMRSRGGAMLSLAPGHGKCFAKGTPVLMYDGSVRAVEDVGVGDVVMGDDSTPRVVASLGRGREMMYDIVPVKGDSFTCNESHILTMKYIAHKRIFKNSSGTWSIKLHNNNSFFSKTFKTMEEVLEFSTSIPDTDAIVDMEVLKYHDLPNSIKHHLKLYRMPVEFSHYIDPIFDPWVIGTWLGDGSTGHPVFTICEDGILNELKIRMASYDMIVVRHSSGIGKAPMYGVKGTQSTGRVGGNVFINALKSYGIYTKKRIPNVIMTGSRDTRLLVLAGLIDTDGHRVINGGFDIVQKSRGLANDIVFVARSLGFAAYIRPCRKGCMYNGEYKENTYYRISILGDLSIVPVVLERKRAPRRLQKKNVLHTGFSIVKKSIDDYYGFTLVGTNHRFLLADFTVVHNTVCALKIACDIGLKTLIVVHKEFLMNQWIERVAQFVPTARVGRLQQKKAEIEGRDIVVAMIHSIALREYPPETFEGFGLTIVDEAHHVSAPIFSQAMFIANSPHVLGLTATPERKDGLQRVLHWFLGNIAYQSEREGRDDVKVEVARFDASHVPIPYNQRTGKMCLASFVTALTEDPDRNVLVMARVAAHHAAGRKIILLSDRRAHCETLLEACRRRGIDAGLYLGGMSPEDLEKSAARRVVLATFALATEGLDIPTLDTLVLATPKSDVVQATGRILRETTGKKRAPLIVDVVDSVGVAYAQFNKRKTFYLKAGFEIVSGATDGRSGASGGRSEETERPSAPMFIDEEST